MLHNIQDMLDPDLPGKKGWREVGRHLKVTERDLNLLKLQYKSNGSPTEGLIEKLKTFTPEPSMKEFVEALISCERSDEANYICNWPWEKRNCTELENHEQPDTVQQPEMVKQLAWGYFSPQPAVFLNVTQSTLPLCVPWHRDTSSRPYYWLTSTRFYVIPLWIFVR